MKRKRKEFLALSKIFEELHRTYTKICIKFFILGGARALVTLPALDSVSYLSVYLFVSNFNFHFCSICLFQTLHQPWYGSIFIIHVQQHLHKVYNFPRKSPTGVCLRPKYWAKYRPYRFIGEQNILQELSSWKKWVKINVLMYLAIDNLRYLGFMF